MVELLAVLSAPLTVMALFVGISFIVGVFLGSRFMFLSSARKMPDQGQAISPQKRKELRAGTRLSPLLEKEHNG